MNSMAIAVGAEGRLHRAVRAAVLKQFETKLLAAADSAEKARIEKEIREAIRARLKRIASPYSLWAGHKLPCIIRTKVAEAENLADPIG